MPITASDVEFRRSTTAGSAGDSTPQADPNAALGKYLATTVAPPGIRGVFDDISGAENAASDVEYRCLFITNLHPTITWGDVKLWLASETAGGADLAIGVDPAGVSDNDSAAAQAATIANESTAPAGVTFSSPTTMETALDLGDIGPDQAAAFWARRTAADTPAINGDGGIFRIGGDTGA